MTGLTRGSLDVGRFRQRYADPSHVIRLPVPLPALDSPQWQSLLRTFAWGMWSVTSTVLALVLFATYLGIGALAHSTHFSLVWALASTLLIWAGPAQIILISTLGSGATVAQAAIAVTVSAIRLFPMVVSVLPMLRTPTTKRRHLVLATHFIAVTLWVECFRLLPQVPRERRIVFTHGLGSGLVSLCLVATTVGYGLAANPPGIVRRGDPVVDAVGISSLDRAQLPAACRRPGAGVGAGAVSTHGDVTHRR
jgi:predicted branched-subunit amino acid permease